MCGILTLRNRCQFLLYQLIFQIVYNNKCPEHLVSYLPRRSSLQTGTLRDEHLLNLPQVKSATGQSTINILVLWPFHIQKLQNVTVTSEDVCCNIRNVKLIFSFLNHALSIYNICSRSLFSVPSGQSTFQYSAAWDWNQVFVVFYHYSITILFYHYTITTS